MRITRRWFLGTSLGGLAGASVSSAGVLGEPVTGVAATPHPALAARVAPALLQRALGALERHRQVILHRDWIGIADFGLYSSVPRFFLVNCTDGTTTSHLVAHGRGSDPKHTGWLQHFSNQPGSEATSAGAFRTGGVYVGEHGRSLHVAGLDPSDDNAASRAIVVHAAWYVSQEMVKRSGMIGRSDGCFAVASSSLGEVLEKLGPGRLIYSERI